MATWAERNAKAQSLGYRNYYDYRIHGYGKTPSTESVTGEVLARARGHRGESELRRFVGMDSIVSVWATSGRNEDGTYKWVDLLVFNPDGSDRIFRLRGKAVTVQSLDRLVDDLDSAGAVISPSPSLDLRQLIAEDDDDSSV